MKRSVALIAPYAAWMVLMTLLPQTAWAYATRGVVVALLLVAGWLVAEHEKKVRAREAQVGAAELAEAPEEELSIARRVFAGLLVGLAVFAVWIAPEAWLWPDGTVQELSPYHPKSCGWTLTIAKLCASAFVISVAEELFFRKWLVEFAGFGWMLVLFGVEHMRWDLGNVRGCVFIAEGVFAGLCYGLLAKRFGILAAIIAHATTNLVLGLYVIFADKWFYW